MPLSVRHSLRLGNACFLRYLVPAPLRPQLSPKKDS